MRFSVAALLTAACAGLTSAYTTPVGATPSGNPISKPALDEIVPVGQPYTITWDPTTTGTVTLVLLRGPSENILPLYPIVEGADNSGTYTWTPESSLEPDTTHYGIQLIDDESGAYQYTSQFGISNPSYSSASASATTTATSPAVSQITDGQVQAPKTTTSYTTTGSSTVTKVVSVVASAVTTATVKTTVSASITLHNSTILSPTNNMTVPATLKTTTTGAVLSSTAAAAASATQTGGAEKLTAAGAVVMGLGAVFWAVL
ncbi:hypothetical protein MMC30_003072 [Trapelia coarctata]|nr:hypothetical protein [Trapelia coarctata]